MGYDGSRELEWVKIMSRLTEASSLANSFLTLPILLYMV